MSSGPERGQNTPKLEDKVVGEIELLNCHPRIKYATISHLVRMSPINFTIGILLFIGSSCGEKDKRSLSTETPPSVQNSSQTPTSVVLAAPPQTIPDLKRHFADDAPLVKLVKFKVLDTGRGKKLPLPPISLAPKSVFSIVVEGDYAERTAPAPRNSVKLAPLKLAIEITKSSEHLSFRGLPGSVSEKSGTDLAASRAILQRHNEFVEGHSGVLVLSKEGVVSDVLVNKPAKQVWETRREIAKLWAEFVPVIPAIPLGRAARWQVAQTIPVAGTFIKQTVVYKLKKRDKNGYLLQVDSLQVGQNQGMLSPGMPAHIQTEMVGMKSTKSGIIRVTNTGVHGSFDTSSAFHGRMLSTDRPFVDFTVDRKGPITFDITPAH